MIEVGLIVYGGASQEKQMLLKTIRKLIGSSDSESSAALWLPEPHRSSSAYENGARTFNPGLYSVAVNNYGMKIGSKPLYNSRTLSANPPLFKCSLFFNGNTFEGSGTNSKQAQHEAARLACKHFGVEVA